MAGRLTHSPAQIVRQLLIDLDLGSSIPAQTWAVHAYVEPDRPDDCITVYDTSMVGDGRIMASGEVQGREGVMIRVRSAPYIGSNEEHPGWNKANDIAATLDEDVLDDTVTISGVNYTVHSASRVSGPIYVGVDAPDTKRHVFTINPTISVRQV